MIIPPRNKKIERLNREDESAESIRIIKLVESREELTSAKKDIERRLELANDEIINYIMVGEADTIKHEGLQIERVVTTRSGWDTVKLTQYVTPDILEKCKKPKTTSHYVKVTRPK